ncbi:MAG: tetraacyldisaccharide 4'-kinase [Aquisalinus sp.]|nr:tetraacyldisaccharide 4'-kinase [Aquisalinus sp.]
MISPPEFWQDPDGSKHPAAVILSPVAAIYDFIGRRKIRSARPFVANKAVICVGNVSMGGVGKTPFAIMLAEHLRDMERSVIFLTRGYGGALKAPTLLSDKHTARESGDEAQLLKSVGPVVVSSDRPQGARLAFSDSDAELLIMDDGFQNPALYKNLSFLLVDADTGFGNGKVFPAGPLREKPASALTRAEAVVFVLPEQKAAVPESLLEWAGEKPVLRCWLEAEMPLSTGQRVVAFCGIGRPEKFYRTARQVGYELVRTKDFPDHHAFTEDDLAGLQALASEHEATLLTTQKDHVRLPHDLQTQVTTLPVRMQVDNKELLTSLLESLF